MVQLQKDLKAIETAGAQVIGVSYDSVEILKKFSDASKITFPLLSDLDSKTIDAYKLRNHEAKAGTRQDGIPYPATIVIDRTGTVRANLPGTTRTRHPNSDLIKAARELPTSGK